MQRHTGLFLTIGWAAVAGATSPAAAQAGRTTMQAQATVCTYVSADLPNVRFSVNWSGERVTGGKIGVVTVRNGVQGEHFTHVWSTSRAQRAGQVNGAMELGTEDSTGSVVGEPPLAVNVELTAGGRVVWRWTTPAGTLRPCA
jgi:hypothetical protein